MCKKPQHTDNNQFVVFGKAQFNLKQNSTSLERIIKTVKYRTHSPPNLLYPYVKFNYVNDF